MKFMVVLEKAENNWAAYCPDILGCIATGRTPEETMKRYKSALKIHLQGLQEDGLPTPEPTARAVLVEL
ncbi:MAG: type II toxin-antitoxin system HicB family antitoxin [Chloroflexi bacterium]|nr:type II toxin-antitoxin system HicB family antitoxin [Chloroflexota bacterium]